MLLRFAYPHEKQFSSNAQHRIIRIRQTVFQEGPVSHSPSPVLCIHVYTHLKFTALDSYSDHSVTLGPFGTRPASIFFLNIFF